MLAIANIGSYCLVPWECDCREVAGGFFFATGGTEIEHYNNMCVHFDNSYPSPWESRYIYSVAVPINGDLSRKLHILPIPVYLTPR